MRVIFIFGPAASGKYTIGTLVSERLGIPLFHNHLTVDLVSSLFEFGTPGFVKLREQIWLESFKEAAIADQSFVFTFHPEASVANDMLPRLESCIEENGGEVQYIELVCSDTEVLNRINSESRQNFGKLTDAEFYKQLQQNGAFEFSALPEPLLRIHSDQVSAEEAAEQIAGRLSSL